MNTLPPGFKFPIVIKVVNSHLIAYSPDFQILQQERLLTTNAEEIALKVGLAYLDVQRKIALASKEHARRGSPLPTPSTVQSSLPVDDYLPLGVASLRLSLGKDTIRRMAQRGEIEFKRTPGGHYRVKLP